MAYVEADTNADTCCLGKSFIILQYTTRSAEVYSYDKASEPKRDVAIVTGATAYDCKDTGETCILVFNESLFYGSSLDHSLINPNQLRDFGVDVWDNPYDKTKGIFIQAHDGTRIPFETSGTKIRFATRVPSRRELRECRHVQLTGKEPWNPEVVRMAEVNITERSEVPWRVTVGNVRCYANPTSDEAILNDMDATLIDLNKGRTINEVTYDPNTLDAPIRRTFVSRQRGQRATEEDVAERFGIGVNRARATLNATLQRGTRSAILPLSRRYHADRMFERR